MNWENSIQKRAGNEAKHENMTEFGQVPSVFIRVTSAIHPVHATQSPKISEHVKVGLIKSH